ncbi:HdeD family acid-resistance protein [uncultured Mycolicibacterium sp.]|uniref:HdeD family acid-resistance protein n=1 Tax=uncultured Mycolicibacterium sp. TaxID=2320817 RepID=UPI00262B813E|nr:HdeD family acid-resistance protein [uncultured Mycolicibacterium sp.]
METKTAPSLLRYLWSSTLVSGLLAVLLGVLVLVWPGESIVAAAVLFGAYLLVSGIAQVVFAFALDFLGGGRVLLFISGAASLVLAVLSIRQLWEGNVDLVVLLLAIWIGVGFMFRGVATTISAISDRTMPGRGWAIFFGVVTLLAGVVTLAWPFESLAVLTLVVGVWLIVLGVFEVIAAFSFRKSVRNLKDALDAAPAPAAATSESRVS